MNCIFYELTGLYCPACGGTRSTNALFHGDVTLAVHENPAVPILFVFGILFLIELIVLKTGKNIRLFPKNPKFWNFMLILWITWDIARNFLPVLRPVT